MAHYAKIENNIVVQVNVVEEDFFNSNPDRYTGQWIQTSYNGNIRGKYAGIGDTYDPVQDIFISPITEEEEINDTASN
jgi:hypothetical protein